MTTWPKATRAQVIARAKQGFGSGLNSVWYSQSTIVGGYRADCSGFVCRALGLTSAVGHGWWGGLNTVTLVSSGAMYEINPNDLKPGDLCGNCGPGTAGDDGHVVVFDDWVTHNDPNDNRYRIYEQCGGTRGPIHRQITWPYPGESRWKAYRYRGITDQEGGFMSSASDYKGFLDYLDKNEDEARRFARLIAVTDGVVATINPDGTYPPEGKRKYMSLSGALGNLRYWSMLGADPDRLAAALAPLLPTDGAPSVETLAAALRQVLGSVDEHPA